MKEMIIILATVILGVYIGVSLVNGDGDSLKSGADSITNEAHIQIEDLVDTNIIGE